MINLPNVRPVKPAERGRWKAVTMGGRHSIRASLREVFVDYGRVAPRIRLQQEIFDSIESSENENTEAISIIVSMDIVKVEHIAGLVAVTVIAKIMIEDAFEHIVQSADAVRSLFVVSAG